MKKSQRQFLVTVLTTLMLFHGQATFRNLSRYSDSKYRCKTNLVFVGFEVLDLTGLLDLLGLVKHQNGYAQVLSFT